MNLKTKSKNISEIFNTSGQTALEAIGKRIGSVSNLKELFEVFSFIESLNVRFTKENLIQKYMLGFCLFFIIFWLIFFIMLSQMPLSFDTFNTIQYCFFSFFIFSFLGFLYIWRIAKRVLCTQYISDLIILKKVALDNNLEFDTTDKKELIKLFEGKFFVFKQGNYSRELNKYIKGEYKNIFKYHYFNLHYVNEHTSTSRDANGNETTDTEYTHYDLYGIIIPFSLKHFIKISNYDSVFKFKKFSKWRTSSISFNQKFEVYTDLEQAVALFLQPKVIEKIEDLYETFPKLDIEVSSKGFLVFSTPDQELLNHSRRYGVDQLDLFKAEITKVLDQTKLHKALEFIQFLKEYCEPT